ncbi:NTP transferase domain-containing protein [Kineosporia sp. A_224]|uniref:phosphocholine cytidylyltransferase family protein n=1 Tax=Kineosporia sp. A_224 TaxID=1962180 RepID=UPI0018E93C4B|nr:phosphocholine cytidylyltransferase family protein [Kineosporia sp. A_224]
MAAALQAVILAAGLGTRLGRPLPKPLTRLEDGRTIMGQQLDNLRSAFGEEHRVLVVVGFKYEVVMETFPDVTFAYNESYDQTNTNRSLLKALRLTQPGQGVLWMNGDVVFDPAILDALRPAVAADRTAVCVNTATTADEEVKYTVDDRGLVAELSKTVRGRALGEAIGINYVAGRDKATLVRHLAACDEQDYFERGLETAIAVDGLEVSPVDITAHFAVEVDFPDDLERANARG